MDLECGRSSRGRVPELLPLLLGGLPAGWRMLLLPVDAPLTAARAPLVRRVPLLGRPMPTEAEGAGAAAAALLAAPPLLPGANRDSIGVPVCFGDAVVVCAARLPAPLIVGGSRGMQLNGTPIDRGGKSWQASLLDSHTAVPKRQVDSKRTTAIDCIQRTARRGEGEQPRDEQDEERAERGTVVASATQSRCCLRSDAIHTRLHSTAYSASSTDAAVKNGAARKTAIYERTTARTSQRCGGIELNDIIYKYTHDLIYYRFS